MSIRKVEMLKYQSIKCRDIPRVVVVLPGGMAVCSAQVNTTLGDGTATSGCGSVTIGDTAATGNFATVVGCGTIRGAGGG